MLRSDIEKNRRAIARIERLVPKLEDALWLARRLEEQSHRGDAEQIIRGASILDRVTDSLLGGDETEAERILEGGLRGLEVIKEKEGLAKIGERRRSPPEE